MTTLQAGKIEELKRGFEGEILLPGDGAYESARKIWNAMIDRRPAVIARCAATADVVRGVTFARDNGLLLAVRGGGHNIAGSAMVDGGLVIDLSPMKAARVDPARRRVTIEAGATLADLLPDDDLFLLKNPMSHVSWPPSPPKVFPAALGEPSPRVLGTPFRHRRGGLPGAGGPGPVDLDLRAGREHVRRALPGRCRIAARG